MCWIGLIYDYSLRKKKLIQSKVQVAQKGVMKLIVGRLPLLLKIPLKKLTILDPFFDYYFLFSFYF